jgi:hypothetical protein
MSSRRKKRRASERRLAKATARTGLGFWTVVAIILVALAVGIGRLLR